jgi:(p)ppGpp synthase/HD superfamily hydrolase
MKIKPSPPCSYAVEKHGGLSTLSTIRELFGNRVADALEFRSDGNASGPVKKKDWRGGKEKYLEHLRNANADALFVAAADKLHNARAMLSGKWGKSRGQDSKGRRWGIRSKANAIPV